MSETRYQITVTLKSSCKESATPADAKKLGRWDYTIDHGGLSISGCGEALSDDMTAYSAAIHGIIDVMKSLNNPCFIVMRTPQKSLEQTAEGIRKLGIVPAKRKAWAHTDLWRQLIEVGNKGGHKLRFEHI